jgi:7-carboxy-7-deazaguanine synthase
MKISEIFYSLQGEGARAGQPSVFIRLSGCSTQKQCYASGVVCDTEFESGRQFTLDELTEVIDAKANGCKWIVWTGGEPCDQLTDEVVAHFKSMGYYQAIETSGRLLPPAGLDFISVSPKVAEHVMAKVFKSSDRKIAELRYVWGVHKPGIPEPALEADHYYLSPHSDGFTINEVNLKYCIKLCLENPQWSLSVQQHKTWLVL